MASNDTLSVYLGVDLFDRVMAAKNAKKFEPKEVVKQALEGALNGNGHHPDPTPRADLSQTDDAQALADDAANIEYTLQYQPNLMATQSMIDNVRDQGGWTIGFSKDGMTEGFWLLFGNPRVLTSD